MSKNNKPPSKKPPKTSVKSVQFDLFSQFVTNDQSEVSNTVEYWERIPKYFLSPQQIAKLRTPTGHADPYEWEYTVRDKKGGTLPYKVEIQPALIKQKDGKYKAFFPTKTEGKIEEILKKIFTDQQYGIHDPQNVESWVRFTYSLIRRELYRVDSGLRYDQIKHCLEVMSKCVLTVYEDGKEIYTGAILQDYCSVDRNRYIADTDAQHVARLPVFISHGVNALQYRQYNYMRLMGFSEQLTCYIYMRLVNRFTFANYSNEFPLMYSDLKQSSGLLQQGREVDNRSKVISALDELKSSGVLLSYAVDERKQGRKIMNIKYIIKPAEDFIKEQKAANKRANEGQMQALNAGIPLVDK